MKIVAAILLLQSVDSIRLYRETTEEEEQTMDDVFNLLDADNDGKITLDEINAFIDEAASSVCLEQDMNDQACSKMIKDVKK